MKLGKIKLKCKTETGTLEPCTDKEGCFEYTEKYVCEVKPE